MEKKFKEESIKIEKENEKINEKIVDSNSFDLNYGLLASKKRAGNIDEEWFLRFV